MARNDRSIGENMTQQQEEFVSQMAQQKADFGARCDQLVELVGSQKQAKGAGGSGTVGSGPARSKSSKVRLQKLRKLRDTGLLGTDEDSEDEEDKYQNDNDRRDSDEDFETINFEARYSCRMDADKRQVDIWQDMTKSSDKHVEDDSRKALKCNN